MLLIWLKNHRIQGLLTNCVRSEMTRLWKDKVEHSEIKFRYQKLLRCQILLEVFKILILVNKIVVVQMNQRTITLGVIHSQTNLLSHMNRKRICKPTTLMKIIWRQAEVWDRIELGVHRWLIRILPIIKLKAKTNWWLKKISRNKSFFVWNTRL